MSRKRNSYSLYLLPQQAEIINKWIDYNREKGISIFKSDYIMNPFIDFIMKDEGFADYIKKENDNGN